MSIEVSEVFLQGSCDAMIMAWNLVDAVNKSQYFLDPVVVINGVKIPRILFVDDMLEIIKSFAELKISNVGNEVFERTNRVELKPCKCKAICKNCIPEETELDGAPLEIVDEHKYVGTIVSKEGRKSDMLKRVKDCKGVLNEVVEVSKTTGVSELRMRYVRMLINACFKSKFKHGCQVWDGFTKAEETTINKLTPDTLKRTLEVPRSTPKSAVVHETGVVDMDLEVAMERVLLAVHVRKMDSSRIAKQLFDSMYMKKIPGFCTLLDEALNLLGVYGLEHFDNISNEREAIKDILTKIQHNRLVEEMLRLTKTDALLLNFDYNGKMKDYLLKLPFHEAKMIFLIRSRMFPTKANFPGRWSQSDVCPFCCGIETDEHLFKCCGYMDLHEGQIEYRDFITLDCSMEKLGNSARRLMRIYDRLNMVNEDKLLNSCDAGSKGEESFAE